MATKQKRAKRAHVAKLTIWGAGEMTPHGRRRIAFWLKRHAADLIADGAMYASRFSGRYMAR